MKRRLTGIPLTVLGAATSLATALPASAQQEALEEVTITAQRREQTLQDVSISVSAFSSNDIQLMNAHTVQDLTKSTPNVTFNTYYETGRPDTVIRGISTGLTFGASSVAPVGYYNDDVFMGARAGQLAQMFDQERVEVLRGPQGTLFGRNTVAGAINFIAKKPTDRFEADGTVTLGRWNQREFEGGVTIPIADTFSMRLAGNRRERDGWIQNVNPNAAPGQREVGDVQNWAARALMQWQPSETATWLLNLHGSGNNSTTPGMFYNGGFVSINDPNALTGTGPVGLRWDQVDTDFPSRESLQARGAALTGTVELGGVTLTSISAWEKVHGRFQQDNDGSELDIIRPDEVDHTTFYSQEIRLAATRGALDWVGGVYYYHEDIKIPLRPEGDLSYADPALFGFDLGRRTFSFSDSIAFNYAVFADLRWTLSDRWTLGVGGRYTYEKKERDSFSQVFSLDTGDQVSLCDLRSEDKWSAPTGRVVLEFKPNRDVLAYGSVSRGFKSGGLSSAGCAPLSFDPETVVAYELGLKTSWLDGRLTVNGALFYNDLKDSQALVFDTDPLDPVMLALYTRNAASSTTYGAELELRWRAAERLTTTLGVGLLHAVYDKFVFSEAFNDIITDGDMPYSPKRTFTGSVTYDIPLLGGTLKPHIDASYRSHQWFEPHRNPRLDEQGGYALVDVAIPWESPDGRITVSAWGKNVMDKRYNVQTLGLNGILFYGAATAYHGLPRTYGVSFTYNFVP